MISTSYDPSLISDIGNLYFSLLKISLVYQLYFCRVFRFSDFLHFFVVFPVFNLLISALMYFIYLFCYLLCP